MSKGALYFCLAKTKEKLFLGPFLIAHHSIALNCITRIRETILQSLFLNILSSPPRELMRIAGHRRWYLNEQAKDYRECSKAYFIERHVFANG